VNNKTKGRLRAPTSKANGVQAKTSSRAHGEEDAGGSSWKREEKQQQRRIQNASERGKKDVFNFLNERQNDPFNKLLGAPAILLVAPSISQSEAVSGQMWVSLQESPIGAQLVDP